MKWELEEWRKLYTRVTAEWASLPLTTRGVGTELIKYADDAGRIPLSGDDPGDAVVRLCAVQKQEARLVRAAVAALLADRYLVREGDTLMIRNLPIAQQRLTPAERAARYRARKASRVGDVGVTPRVTFSDVSSPQSDAKRHPSEIVTEDPPYPHGVGDRLGDVPEPDAEESGVRIPPNSRAHGTNPRARQEAAERPPGIIEPGTTLKLVAPPRRRSAGQ